MIRIKGEKRKEFEEIGRRKGNKESSCGKGEEVGGGKKKASSDGGKKESRIDTAESAYRKEGGAGVFRSSM